VEGRIEALRLRLEAYEQMLAHLQREDDTALQALADELERQAKLVRAELAELDPTFRRD
jgi:hypothetical protein